MADVWIVNPYAGGPGIGTGWRHWQLARRWRSQGIDVRIITASTGIGGGPRADPGDRKVDGVPFRFVACRTYSGNGVGRVLSMLEFGSRVGRALRSSMHTDPKPTKMVLASSPHPFALAACASHCRRQGIRLGVELRDIWPESLTEVGGVSPYHPFVIACGAMIRRGIAAADVVVSPLAGIGRYLSDNGLPVRPTVVVPNGTDLDGPGEPMITGHAATALRRARSEERFVILYAGALGRPNAMHQLLEAIELLPLARRSRLTALIVGDGTERLRLERTAARIGAGAVTFLGRMPEPEVRSLARECDAGFIGWLDRDVYRYGTSPQKVPMMLSAGLPIIEAAPSARPDPLPDGTGWSCRAERPVDLAATIERAMATGHAERLGFRVSCERAARDRWCWDRIATEAAEALGLMVRRREAAV